MNVTFFWLKNTSTSSFMIHNELIFHWLAQPFTQAINTSIIIWDKVFKNGPSKICGRQPLKNLKADHIPPNFLKAVQGLNYLFRRDPRRFREKFQQLDGMGSALSPPLGVWGQNAIQMQENSVQFNTFWSKI